MNATPELVLNQTSTNQYKAQLDFLRGKKYRKSKIEIWKNGLTEKLWFSKTVIQLWNVSVISVIIESWINSEFVLLWDVQKMGQQTSNSRIQQIAKSKGFFQQQMWFANVWESGNWCSRPFSWNCLSCRWLKTDDDQIGRKISWTSQWLAEKDREVEDWGPGLFNTQKKYKEPSTLSNTSSFYFCTQSFETKVKSVFFLKKLNISLQISKMYFSK